MLRAALGRCRSGFVAAGVFSLCINMLMLAAPLYMLQLFDRVITSRSTDTLVMLTLITVGALVVMALLDGARNVVLVRLSSWLDRRLGDALLTDGIAGAAGRNQDPGVQGLRDMSTFRSFLASPALFAILDMPWSPIFIAVIFLMHPVLGIVALIGAVVLFAIALANDFATRKPLRESSEASIQALQQAEAASRNADVIQAMGMMPEMVRRWHEHNDQSLDRQAVASIRSGGLTAMSKFVRLSLQIGMLASGATLVLAEEITPGVMIAASILMGRSLAPVEQAIGSWRNAVGARNAYRRIKQRFATMPPTEEPMQLPRPTGVINVEGVTYLHEGATEPVLRNVSFTLAAGETLGLIGPSASGKTTLARLLMGNLVPRAGHVRLDGADIGAWAPSDRGKYVGYLPQDVELFGGTVRTNIARMGVGDPDEVVEAARLAGVHDMILRLPEGYETEIGQAGAQLSGGERQRIALARAIFANPCFVVLDEPNASLDRAGEDALVQAISRLKEKGATVVIIAHRPSILRHVDKILVLRDGVVQNFGPRNEVVPHVVGPGAGTEPSAAPDVQVGKA